MPANTSPIYSLAPDVQWSAAITAANTAKDGTGTTNLVFTADATNGGYINKLRFTPLGSNVATVARVFINNGLTPATAANNFYYGSITIPVTTNSEVASIGHFDMPMGFALPAGYRVYVLLGTAVSAGIQVAAIAGKY